MKGKNFWYVLVVFPEESLFVTGINNKERFAHWKENEKPKVFTRSEAMDLLYGLRMNGFEAFAVCHPIEIEEQI